MIVVDPVSYEPTTPELIIVKSRISHGAWVARVAKALRESEVLEKIAAHVAKGVALGAAILKEVPWSRRSWVYHHWAAYKKDGWSALIDKRLPREPKVAKACGKIIESAREANPGIDVDGMLKILDGQKVQHLPSSSTIQKYFRRADRRLGRRREKLRAAEEIIEMSCAGGELLLAAELETGSISALTTVVEELSEEALEASKNRVPERDIPNRDAKGRFTAEYNMCRAREPGEEVASYLRTAEEKAEGRVPSWPRFVHERRETIEAKLRALTFAPLVSGTQGWDALRSAQACELGSLAGFPYMPSTLYKFTSALAISGAGGRMLEAVGTNWHQVATQRWAEGGAIAALYVDNHAKEVWTSLFTMSGKVSSLNRIMPCITTTYVHTGAGTPLVASVQSGSAPLAPRLLALVERAEKVLGDGIARATIIDSEGSVFDTLEAFDKAGRIIVTPLRPSRAPELQLSYTPGSYYRPYREHDEIRVAQAQLHHRTTGRTIELGAILIRRGNRESETVLLTTGIKHGFGGRELADLYFLRWPLQENCFKDGEVVGLDRHRGNSSRMVANVAVITELEKLRKQHERVSEKLRESQSTELEHGKAVASAERESRASELQLETLGKQMDAMISAGDIQCDAFSRIAVEHREVQHRAAKASGRLERSVKKLAAARRRTSGYEAALEKQIARKTKLEPRQEIRQLDTALDSILTSTKLTCLLLISFVLREYLPSIAMTPQTFVSRVFGLRGRRELRPDGESVIFYANQRDPEITKALEAACKHLNARGLMRNNRPLRYSVEDRPEP